MNRGQAVVEMALGTVVFITVLTFGIHFAEIGFFELKSQEAANAALFDSTSGHMHDWPTDSSAATTTVANATAEVQGRYQDFNGLSGSSNGSTLSNVFTYAQNMQVSCSLGGGAYPWGPSNWYTNAVFNDNGGLKCGARSDVHVGAAMPVQFLDRTLPGGLFDTPAYSTPGLIRACGLGRNVGGNCPGEYTMLLDDWGFSGLNSPESDVCVGLPYGLPCAGNKPYWKSVGIVYGESLTFPLYAADQFTWSLVGMDPLFLPGLGEMTFYMSFEGEQTLFQQPVWARPPEGLPVWATTPFSPINPTDIPYTVAYAGSSGCYLGQSCRALSP
ncbi:MAG TPA: hypothetical protein VH208_00290 [Myxococcaceae bacterium]|nr:hypothetical protein [Myxococcaceae bacterium]